MIDTISKNISSMLVVVFLAAAPGSGLAAQADKTKVAKAPPVTEDPGPWLLAGREGECAPLSILSEKGAEYSDIQSPAQLVERLRAAGHKADIKEFKAGIRPSVEVRAPSAGLYVMFVKKEFCDKLPPPPTK
jgi:hypothetical protein